MATTIRDIDDLLDTSIEDFKEKLYEILDGAEKDFKQTITTQSEGVLSAVSEALGGGLTANAVGGGLESALSSLASGRDISARRVATTAARAFNRDVDDFFRQSSSQIADDISGFLGFGSRNN